MNATSLPTRGFCLAAALALAAPPAARADDEGFFGKALKGVAKAVERLVEGNEEPAAPAVNMVLANVGGNVDQFTPALKRLAAVEVAYVRKVCGPDAAQLAAIRKRVKAQVPQLAKRLAAAQNGRAGQLQFPNVRKLMTEALHDEIGKAMSAEKANAYAEEIAARDAAKTEAGIDMLTAQIDRSVYLAPAQYDKMKQAVRSAWKEEWSRNPQVFLYSEYLPTPDVKVTSPILNERQKEIWGARPHYGTISFGWEEDLGLGGFFGGAAIEEEEEEERPIGEKAPEEKASEKDE